MPRSSAALLRVSCRSEPAAHVPLSGLASLAQRPCEAGAAAVRGSEAREFVRPEDPFTRQVPRGLCDVLQGVLQVLDIARRARTDLQVCRRQTNAMAVRPWAASI